MCGICGEVRYGGQQASVQAVARMMDALAPRGPDGSGVVAHGPVALGHRRLKIIDLSERAAQPMVDPHLGLSIAYNGAIYNYPELRRELEERGYRFFSTGDTEVLLKAYDAWGERCVERLQGMFAFAILERDSGRLFLARDRLGIKPLYYTAEHSTFRFASSLPALLAPGDIPSDIDPVALHHYLTFHAVVPAPHTILQRVRKLPPASTLVLHPDGSRREGHYWEPEFAPAEDEPELPFVEWRDRTLAALRRAVARRLIADVPVGVLLSGGLDSSLVVGLLAEAGQHVETFSIGFESVGDEIGHEFVYSDIIAQRYETKHHKIFVDTARALPSLTGCIEAMSEPMVSHDAIGFYLLSQEVRKHVTVVQSGQGADEIFAGYHWYPPLLGSSNPVDDYARVFFDRSHDEFARVVVPELVTEDWSRAFVADRFGRPGATHAVDQALRIDTTIMLVDDPVKRVDNMTMASGLEARVPFLDHELVELAARIPAKYKVAKGGKYVLKEAARLVIPHEVIDRPKGYFPVPALKHLRGPYLDLVEGALTSPRCRQRGLFRSDYISELLREPEGNLTPLGGSKLWQLGLLELWFQAQGI